MRFLRLDARFCVLNKSTADRAYDLVGSVGFCVPDDLQVGTSSSSRVLLEVAAHLFGLQTAVHVYVYLVVCEWHLLSCLKGRFLYVKCPWRELLSLVDIDEGNLSQVYFITTFFYEFGCACATGCKYFDAA